MSAHPKFDLQHATQILSRTPAVLRSLLGGVAEEWARASEGPDTFTPYDVVGHLLHGERTDWIPRARIIVAQGEDRTFEPYDRFAMYRESEGRTLDELLGEFDRLRQQNLETLADLQLTDADLSLEGHHPSLGTVTLRQLLATWTAHDLSHIGQIVRVMAKRYREDVGPWRAYLPIMDR